MYYRLELVGRHDALILCLLDLGLVEMLKHTRQNISC